MTPPAATPQGSVVLSADALGRLMPMFLICDAQGRIDALGPTMKKILGGAAALGALLTSHFTLRVAQTEEGDSPDRVAGTRRRLHLVLRARPEIVLRGSSVELGEGRVLINLTFGIHLAEAVRAFDLTETDFAASDMAIELLYMAEANVAVLGELGALTSRLEMARRTAEAQALSDPLTGLANRRGLDQAIDAEMAALAQGGSAFAVAHLDLDYFKQVNDTLGHAAGDHVLMIVAQRLTRELRRGDIVARTGGDEFLLLLRGGTDEAALRRLGERLIHRLEQPYTFEGKTCQISASIGIAVSLPIEETADHGQQTQRLMEAADRALYAAKRGGRGRCVMAGEIGAG
ncbi:GGDEF domain-containing protein [Sinirhodobacter populi]|uniref:diguanylate cyclase n=1 Tax=Paenirhodobacter populi TaxID=2306993 RepID=A0A443KAJ9_9RHOB|nr:GGDEF domain-containing protein [Sinirhodobacter populi]RWR29726.1 GGDEF domain-containing protein [Sinirhodobacter populi]